MKRINGLYTIMAATLLLAGCTDKLEQNLQYTKIVPGEEIPFGATAHFENAEKDPKKSASTSNRTIYGDISNGLIEVNWVPGIDHVEIISPQAGGAPVAEFKVAGSENTDGNYGVDGTFNGTNRVDSLERIGDAGLQWSTSDFYEFYAMYPSIGQLKKVAPEVASGSYGLQKEVGSDGVVKGVLTGYLPVTQTPDISRSTNNDGGYVIAPDMTYAYMVAKEYYEVPENKNYEANKIQMNFESLVTALEFELVANFIGKQNDGTDEIKVISVMLTSDSLDIAGKFKYTFPAGTDESIANGVFKSSNDGSANYRSITMKLSDEGFALSEGMKLNVTFFVLPTVGVKNQTFNDLSLTVFYKVADQPQIKTATIKKAVVTRKYTRFANVKLPRVAANVTGSKWFSALDNDVLVSQVSIPMAANAFANNKYVSNLGSNYTQQTSDITALWNMGVRGFEMCVEWEPNENNSNAPTSQDADKKDLTENHNLDNCYIIASEKATNVKFRSQLDLLYKAMFETVDGKETQTGEPLVLLVTFQPRASGGSGYNPYYFAYQLINSLSKFATEKGYDSPSDLFVQLNSSTTIADLKGKIAVIVRPGSDERWAYEHLDFQAYKSGWLTGKDYRPCYDPLKLLGISAIHDGSDYNLTKQVWDEVFEKHSAWKRLIAVVNDWGTDSWDSWHRRFGEDGYYYYASTGTAKTKIEEIDGRTALSQHLYESQILGYDAPTDAPTARNYYYDHSMSNGGIAYVQDMVRVVPAGFPTKIKNNLTVTWSESESEKKAAINGLFQKSVNRDNKSNNIYINNLSSYYVIEGHAQSWYPCIFTKANGYNNADVFEESGKGGDYASCAKEMTTHTYGLLNGTITLSGGKKLAQGPWGIVMMDYIGDESNTDSKKLVNLIMMNNFSFPLAKENTNAYRTVKITDEKFNPELPLLDWK